MRFLCVLLLVGLVAGPAAPSSEHEVPSRMAVDPGMAHAQSGASSHDLVATRSAYGAVAGSIPVTLQAATPRSLRGYATWYDAPSPSDAAAGPLLRKALGRHWRGSTVRVCADECVTVRLTDWCACGSRHGVPTVIDLDDVAFERLAPQSWDPVDDGPFLSQGVVRVRVTVLGQIDVPLTRPAPTAPPTDVER